jgi:hypothetical protein
MSVCDICGNDYRTSLIATGVTARQGLRQRALAGGAS